MAALVASVESGTALTEDTRGHLRQCDRCSTILDGARAMERSLVSNAPLTDDPASPEMAEVAAEEARRLRRKRIAARLLLTIASVAIFGFLLFVSMTDVPGEGAGLLIAGVAIALLLAVPAIALMSFARSARGGRPALYKRLGPGKQLSGVCVGLAERTGWPVTIFRVIFVALFFANGFGLVLYILFDLVMPVHPADRQYLLRFRLARAWRGFRDRRIARPT